MSLTGLAKQVDKNALYISPSMSATHGRTEMIVNGQYLTFHSKNYIGELKTILSTINSTNAKTIYLEDQNFGSKLVAHRLSNFGFVVAWYRVKNGKIVHVN